MIRRILEGNVELDACGPSYLLHRLIHLLFRVIFEQLVNNLVLPREIDLNLTIELPLLAQIRTLFDRLSCHLLIRSLVLSGSRVRLTGPDTH